MKNKLLFDEEEHKYTVGDKELVSVTTYIKESFNPFEKELISKRVAKRDGKTQEEVLKEWEQTGLDGTAVHEEVENYIKDGTRPVIDKALYGMIHCQNECSFYDKLVPEMRVYSEELGIAGTIDLVVYKPTHPSLKPRVILKDWKTNKKIYTQGFGKTGLGVCSHLVDCNYNHYALQLSLYAYILEREYDVIVDGLELVHLKKAGYFTYKMDYMKELVRELVGDRK